MSASNRVVRAAAVQTGSVLFDRDATLQKVQTLAAQAADEGARVILFPEALVSGYPRGLGFGTVVGRRTQAGRKLYQRYWDSAVDVPGPTTERLGEIAAAAKAHVAIGVIERDGGTLYCTLLYLGPNGSLLGKHRKLKPTGGERLIWGEGDGSTLTAIQTGFATVGGLICWENYMPLARMAMYQKGVGIYLAPTADARDSWQATLRHIACEGRCFVIGCNQFVTREMYPEDLRDELPTTSEPLCRGGTAMVSPMGDVLAGPLFDREGIVYADLDLDLLTQARYDFDVVGHYARPDVFALSVDERPRASVSLETEP